MLRVALTGGMGSGKTAAAAIFRELGCFVSQSDEVARFMMQPGEPVYNSIVHAFGPAVVTPDQSLDRRTLAQLAFADGRIEELNSIVHPAVIAHQSAWMRSVAEQDAHPIAMVESALIFETKHGAVGTPNAPEAPWRTRFDRIVLITAPEDLRIDRYVRRVGASTTAERSAAQADARARLQAQMPDAEKAALSDCVIRNDSSLDALRSAIKPVYERLRQESADRAEESM